MTEQYQRYDYAWKQPGWTVQNPTFLPPDQTGFDEPGLPDDVSKVEIIGEFLDPLSGRRLEGVLEYRTSDILKYTSVDSDDNPVVFEVMPEVRLVRFTDAQPLSVQLPATDDTNLVTESGDPWVWHFRLTVQGVTREFSHALPSTPDQVEIWDLMGDQT